MFEFFSMLLAKIAAVVKWFGDLGIQVFKDAWEILTDLPAWAFDQVLGVAVAALGELDLTGITQYTQAAGDLPAEVMNILGLLGVGTATAIIGAAIGIRLVLQLIPFTRLGS